MLLHLCQVTLVLCMRDKILCVYVQHFGITYSRNVVIRSPNSMAMAMAMAMIIVATY